MMDFGVVEEPVEGIWAKSGTMRIFKASLIHTQFRVPVSRPRFVWAGQNTVHGPDDYRPSPIGHSRMRTRTTTTGREAGKEKEEDRRAAPRNGLIEIDWWLVTTVIYMYMFDAPMLA